MQNNLKTSATEKILNYYKQPGEMTLVGDYAPMISKLPDDTIGLTKIVQGLIIHEFTAANFYGVNIPENREEESHIRQFSQMIDKIMILEDKPIDIPRPPEKRLVGVCHHFAKFLVSLLRAKGIPSRMRYGFGDYFNPGYFEDHSICEHWNEKERQWLLIDPQFDVVWQKELNIKHDIYNVPRDHFLIQVMLGLLAVKEN